MTEIEMLEKQIDDKEENIRRNYSRITPFQLQQMKIEICNLKIRKTNLEINELMRIGVNDPVDRLELEKLKLLIQYHEKTRQQAEIRLRNFNH